MELMMMIDRIDMLKYSKNKRSEIIRTGVSRDDIKELLNNGFLVSLDPNLFTKFKTSNHVNDVIKEIDSQIARIENEVKKDKLNMVIELLNNLDFALKSIDGLRTIAFDESDYKTYNDDYILENILDYDFKVVLDSHIELLTTDIVVQSRLKNILDYTDDEIPVFYTLRELIDLNNTVVNYTQPLKELKGVLINELSKPVPNFPIDPERDKVVEFITILNKPKTFEVLKTIENVFNTI
jgi:hypothetical protein